MKNSQKTIKTTTCNNFAKFLNCALGKKAKQAIKGGEDGIGIEDELLT